MICSLCGGYVIWVGPLTDLRETECQDCGAVNAQEIGSEEPEEEWEL